MVENWVLFRWIEGKKRDGGLGVCFGIVGRYKVKGVYIRGKDKVSECWFCKYELLELVPLYWK